MTATPAHVLMPQKMLVESSSGIGGPICAACCRCCHLSHLSHQQVFALQASGRRAWWAS